MRVNPANISFVFQGAVPESETEALASTIAKLRELAPGAEIIVSTWHGTTLPTTLGADRTLFSADPGPLHSIRPDGASQNNVNRQIVSTSTGLAAAGRPFAVKMRTDSALSHAGFLDVYADFANGGQPILACSFFTLDPRMFEQVPLHVSDWFHFGPTELLRSYWSATLMSPDDAEYYSKHEYAAHSSYLDKRFYCRLASEQHVAVQHVQRLGWVLPSFHNDNRPAVLHSHDRFLREKLIIADPDQLGLVLPKYAWVVASDFQRLNCVMHIDWLADQAAHGRVEIATEQLNNIARRQKRKKSGRFAYKLAQPFSGILSAPILRATVNRVIKFLVLR